MIWKWTLNKTNFGPIANFTGEELSVLGLKSFGCRLFELQAVCVTGGFISLSSAEFDTNEMKWSEMKAVKQCPELGQVRAQYHLGWCSIKSLLRHEVTGKGTCPPWGTVSATSTEPPALCHQHCALPRVWLLWGAWTQQGYRSQPSSGAAWPCLCQYSCTHRGWPGLLWPLLATSAHFCSLVLCDPALL